MDVPAGDVTPIWQQALGALIGIGTLCGMLYNALKPKKTEADAPASHLVLEQGSLADVRWARERMDRLIDVVADTRSELETLRTVNERILKIAEQGLATQDRHARSHEALCDDVKLFYKDWTDGKRETEKEQMHEMRMQVLMKNALKNITDNEDKGRS